jgi:DNA polymerase-3 subunit alpha
MMSDLQTAMEIGQAKQRDQQLGQSSMFETFEEEISAEPQGELAEEWTDQERLCFEKESIGFYVTGHPLNSFTNDIAWFTDASSASILENGTGKDVSIAGIPIKVSPKTTKKGDRMAIVSLEDLKGSIDVIIWPETYAATENLLLQEEPLLVKGSVDSDGNLPKVIAKEICLLSQAKEFWKGKVHIHFRTPGLEKDTLKTIREILSTHKGNNEIFLEFLFPDSKVRVVSADPELKVQPSDEIICEIEAVLGEDSIRFE